MNMDAQQISLPTGSPFLISRCRGRMLKKYRNLPTRSPDPRQLFDSDHGQHPLSFLLSFLFTLINTLPYIHIFILHWQNYLSFLFRLSATFFPIRFPTKYYISKFSTSPKPWYEMELSCYYNIYYNTVWNYFK